MLRSGLTLLVVVAVCATACAPTSLPPSTEAPEADAGVALEIAKMWKVHIAAAQSEDVAAVMDIYAPDAVYIVPGSADHRGRPAIEAMERLALQSNSVLEAVHTTLGLHVVGDVAYEIGKIVGPVQPVGGAAAVVTFHYVAQWRRQADGVWRMEHFMGQPA